MIMTARRKMADFVAGNLWATLHKTGNVLVIGKINSVFSEEDTKIQVPKEMLNNLYKYARFVMLNGSTDTITIGKTDSGYQIEIQCMGYDELEKHDTYEIRSFESDRSYDKDIITLTNREDRKNFRKLLKYFT